MRARIGTALTTAAGKPRSSITAAIGIETFIVSGLPQASATRVAEARARAATCGPLTPRSSASSRIRSARGSSGRCTGWPNPGQPAARGADRRAQSRRRPPAGVRPAPTSRLRRARAAARTPRRCRGSPARSRGSPPRPRPAATRVGRQRHPRGDVRRHHPVLGDRDEQQVEEEPLRPRSARGRSAAGGSTR